jgi:hypothetical protein
MYTTFFSSCEQISGMNGAAQNNPKQKKKKQKKKKQVIMKRSRTS